MFLDPSLGILWAAAISCIWYGACRSLAFFREIKDETPKELRYVQSKKVLILPVIGSVVLLLLFYFLDFKITIYILIVLISIVVFSSQFFVFAPLADKVFAKLWKEPKGFNLPKLGFIPVSGIVLSLYAGGIIALWICTGHWLVVDAIAWCLGITQLCILRLPSMKMSALLLIPFVIYDVFWVFVSPLIFHGESVMESVALRLPPFPLMLKLPHITDNNFYSGLGLGDIALPGLFMVFLFSFDDYLGRRDHINWNDLGNSYLGYFKLSLIEYSLGYIVTLISGSIMNSGQPALLYLVPFTMGFSALFAWRRNELGLMWKGIQDNDKEDEDKQTLLEEGRGENVDDDSPTDKSKGEELTIRTTERLEVLQIN